MDRNRSTGSFSSVARVENITETLVTPAALGRLIVDGHGRSGKE